MTRGGQWVPLKADNDEPETTTRADDTATLGTPDS